VIRELPRLTLALGRVLCADCVDEAAAANHPADLAEIVTEFTQTFGRAADDGFPVAHIEPTRARLVAADYRCDACDATGRQAIEPGGPLHNQA
jgi:hypothetical protein